MANAAGPSGTSKGPGHVESENSYGLRCPEHDDRVAELFCRRCRRCVCTLCPVLGAHRGHPVGLALEEAVHVQKFIQECLKQLAAKNQQQVGNRRQIEDTAEHLKAGPCHIVKLQGPLGDAEQLKGEAVHLPPSATSAKAITAKTSVNMEVLRRSHAVPHVPLQEFTATERELKQQMSREELCHPVPQSFEPVKSFFKGLVEAMRRMLQMPLDVRLKENMNCQLSSSSSTKLDFLLKTSFSPERSLFLKYARTPTLDPDTMHVRLRLSADRLTVRCALLGRLGPTPALRFDALWQVLGRDCFAAGRHYWEVDVQEAGAGWWVGVAYASLRRHGESAAARLGCNRQSWCLKRYDLEYWAFHDCQRSRLQPHHDPDRLGIFLDYEAGILSFYDVSGSMRHLHTFRAAFQEPLYPALRLWEGAISIPRLP
ncbi:tripartite motif-containing protein 14 [Pteropus vampyrus]|uniref:Tripartite motif-containing protein 14 n=1 Tax=Pteropus vampyrus TaxID=132908 RepID=A0A6P3QKD6_PTEVA|nr:tripartite motif-containing protein 14 [Pteropus vampyrus]